MDKFVANIKKNRKIYAALFLILLFGMYLRVYHIDYPTIGYHNWKESHYLAESRNFAEDGFFNHGFFVPEWDALRSFDDPTGAHSDTFPVISILIAIAFKIFGPHLWVARLVGIIFSLGTVLMMFLLSRELFKRDDIAIIAAALTAINPLFVFFSHNVQLINPGVFFMLSSAYFYVRWRDSDKNSHLISTAVFLSLAGLTKYTFLVIAIPFALTFPYKKLLKLNKSQIKAYSASFAAMLTIPAWFLYSKTIVQAEGTALAIGEMNIWAFLTPGWWKSVWPFLSDNYTVIGFWFAIAGIVMLVTFYNSNKKFAELFLLSYSAALIPFIMIMSNKLKGHSYHQFPIAPIIILTMSYFILVVSQTSIGLFKVKAEKKEILKWIVILVLFIVLLSPSMDAKNKQFDTQFFGLDIAGDYIRENSEVNEKVIFSGGQSFGFLWNADRKAYYSTDLKLDILKEAEENGVRWIFMYHWGFKSMQNSELHQYLGENYNLRQMAYLSQGKDNAVYYIVLEKGEGGFSMDSLQSWTDGKELRYKDYDSTSGKIKLYYVN
ncbi:MAG: glycosyltransferase family 39 protein [archaeon]|jgi:4-amino-4-deoxy-L-arabinose transferase-like glycosyltransferase|nr:glycosyltransferase family 39 protein [archaeon]